MSRIRTLVVCPGRGSYDRASLGTLAGRGDAAATAIEICDAHRRALGRPTVSELDSEPAFRASRHVAGEHASLLTFAAGIADHLELDRSRYEIVGVAGNSMGWYTALAVSGALPLEEAVRLVETMGAYQAGNVIGGQVLYPVTDSAWNRSPAAEAAVARVLAQARETGAFAEWSIRLGGFAVLAGDGPGVRHLLQHLPKDTRGERTFPLQLPFHSAFHTALMEPTSDRAQLELSDLAMRPPELPLVDGRGRIHAPMRSDPLELLDYTLSEQVVAPYDFTTSIRTALRHLAPDVLVCLGPGNALGGPIARILVQEGWRGARTRAQLDELQQSDSPVLSSFGVALQKRRLV